MTKIQYILSAKNRKASILVLNELEDKLSYFYGANIAVATIAMDTWLCHNMCEMDNVVFCLEPSEST